MSEMDFHGSDKLSGMRVNMPSWTGPMESDPLIDAIMVGMASTKQFDIPETIERYGSVARRKLNYII